MLYRDCIEKLLQLKDVIVTNIECQGREMHIWLRMEQRMHFCPCCGTITGKVHDYRTQLVKIFPYQDMIPFFTLENAVMYVLNVANDSMNV